MIDNSETSFARIRAEAETGARQFLANEAVLPAFALVLESPPEEVLQVEQAVAPVLPSALREAVRTLRETECLDGVANPGPIWVVVAEAAALWALRGEPNAGRVAETAERLKRAPSWAYEVWRDACVRRLSNLRGEAQRCWLSELGAPPVLKSDKEESKRPVSVGRDGPGWPVADALQLWQEEPVAFYEVSSWPPLNLLHDVDKKAWFNAIDSWIESRLVHGALLPVSARDSPQDLLEFLREARPCFCDEGRATGACAAVVLCDVALASAENLLGAEEGELGNGVAERFLMDVASTIMGRSDSRPLAAAFAARLAHDAFLIDNTYGVPTSVRSMAWTAISEAFAEAGVPVREQRALLSGRRHSASARGEPVRRALPAFLVAVRTLRERRGEDLEELLDWLVEVLRDPEEWTLKHAVNFLVGELVTVLMLSETPVSTCKRLYNGLEPMRRRAEFSKTYLERDLALPSLLLLVTLASLVDQGLTDRLEQDLTFIRDRAARLAMTVYEETEPVVRARDVIAIALCVGCARFGLDHPSAMVLVQPFAWDREVLGLLLPRVAKLAGRGNIEIFLSRLGRPAQEVIDDASSWASSTGHPFDLAIAAATTTALAPLDTTASETVADGG